jgi:hypothetical protein
LHIFEKWGLWEKCASIEFPIMSQPVFTQGKSIDKVREWTCSLLGRTNPCLQNY